jgi:H+/Cl- antiporter ClcA
MSFLSFLIGLIVPVAHAGNLDTWGAENSGVAAMWSMIRSTLYTQDDPVAGLSESAIGFVFPLVGACAVLVVLYAGIKMIWGRGKDDSVTKAKDMIFYALMGVVLAVLAATIVGFVSNVFLPTLFGV